MKLRSFMFLTLAFIAISCGKDPVTTPAPQVASEPPGNVAHAEMVLLNQSDAPHFMDIYLPETTGETPPQPVLFYIHGGSWYMNSRAELTVAQMKALSGGKYVVVTTDYTLAKYGVPNLVVPQVLTDLAVNIKWLRDHASEYDMDGKRIIIMGHSSGSHMAALCALDRSHFTEVGANFDAIKGAICLDGGPYLNDVDKLLNGYPWSAGIRTAWTSVAGNDTRVWPQYIPAKIIDTSVTPPPFLLVHSSKYNYRYESNEAFEKALTDAGVTVERHPMNWEHGDFVTNLGTGQAEYNTIIKTFLDINF